MLEASDEGPRLRFAIMRNESMGIAMGGTTGNPIPFYPCTSAEKTEHPTPRWSSPMRPDRQDVNIADAYTEEGFDFSGTRNFDKKTGYARRRS